MIQGKQNSEKRESQAERVSEKIQGEQIVRSEGQ